MKFIDTIPVKQKLVAIQILTACTVLVMASVVFVAEDISASRETAVQRLSSTALIIGENSVSSLLFLDADAAAQILGSLAVEPHILHGCIYDQNGEVFATYSREGSGEFAFPAAAAESHQFAEKALVLFKEIVHNQTRVGTVYLHADVIQLRERMKEFVYEALVLLGFGLLVSMLLSIFFQKKISDPILHLTEAAKSVSRTGDYTGRVAKESGDEIGELCDGFNEMLGQIEQRDAELREAQEVLEKRVQERTFELSQTNDTLQAEIAERRQTEKELSRAKEEAEGANRAKSVFLTNMSHEIRTPMNAILGYAQILRDDAELPERQRRAMATIEQSGEHLLSLINDILDISKIEAGREAFNPTDFDLPELVHRLAAMFAARCQQKRLTWRLGLSGRRRPSATGHRCSVWQPDRPCTPWSSTMWRPTGIFSP